MRHLHAALALALCLTAPAAAQTVYRVSARALSGGDGASWSTAFQHVDEALAVATAGDSVWVAAGTYRPTVELVPGDPRSRSFAPAIGVRLFGGFAGFETTLSGRAGLYRATILDGDLGIPGVDSDNARNVVRLEGNGARHWVDGFTIRGGNADGTGLARGGGAIAMQLGEKWIRNCLLVDNRGGIGGALLSQISLTHVERCVFRGNSCERLGGAAWIGGQCYVTDTLFEDNEAGQRGGAIYANQGILDGEQIPVTRFQNSLFLGNRAQNGGAAFIGDPAGVVAAGKAAWSGCTFYGNIAFVGGAAVASNSTPSQGIEILLYNSILWGNLSREGTTLKGDAQHFRDVRHCLIEGGWPGAGNFASDPLFRNAQAGDLRLGLMSPAVDAGDPLLVLRDYNDIDRDGNFIERTPIDALGSPRLAGAAPDLGAFEQ